MNDRDHRHTSFLFFFNKLDIHLSILMTKSYPPSRELSKCSQATIDTKFKMRKKGERKTLAL